MISTSDLSFVATKKCGGRFSAEKVDYIMFVNMITCSHLFGT